MSFLNVTAMTSGPIKRQTWKRIELTVGFFGFWLFLELTLESFSPGF